MYHNLEKCLVVSYVQVAYGRLLHHILKKYGRLMCHKFLADFLLFFRFKSFLFCFKIVFQIQILFWFQLFLSFKTICFQLIIFFLLIWTNFMTSI